MERDKPGKVESIDAKNVGSLTIYLCRFENVDHLGLEGDMDKVTEYSDRHNTAARRGDKRSRFKLKQDLITPYGNYAGSAIRLGDPRRYNEYGRQRSVSAH